jgi:simple sugar transport system ATP-binding protein
MTQTTTTSDAPAVELRGVTKTFPGVLANDDVDLVVRAGEVHCLLGENGAGKSTLMGILSGMVEPDSGRIVVGGGEVTIDSPRRALELGIGTVYQHVTLVPTLTVLENLLLGESRGLRLERERARGRLAEFARMLGVELDPDARAGDLSLGQQQQVEIVKALWRGSAVLILDEPTSMLTPQGVVELQNVLVRLKSEGLAIVFITHKLHEALEIGDRVTILKQGRVVGSLAPAELRGRSVDELQARVVALMFGEEAREELAAPELEAEVRARHVRRELPAEPLLELVDASARPEGYGPGLAGVSFGVRPGEIFGIAGVDGNGQRELAEAIAGQHHLSHGRLLLAGAPINHLSLQQRQRLGLRYVTDDRLGEGTVSSLSVALNLVLKRIGRLPFWRHGRIQQRVVEETAADLVRRFDVRTPSVRARVATLSGGNVQKVLLARELSFEPRVVVYNKPTHGLDVKTAQAVRERIRVQADEGVTAIVISTELEELLDLCDRIGVLFRGRLTGVVENEPGAEREIGQLMVGGAARAETAA